MAMLVSKEFTVAKQKLPLVRFDLMITEYNAHQSELTCHALGKAFAALNVTGPPGALLFYRDQRSH